MNPEEQQEQDRAVKLSVNLISEKESILKTADFIIAPGTEGILGIAPAHTKLVSLLKKGEIILKENHQPDQKFSLNDGIIKVNRNDVEILINI